MQPAVPARSSDAVALVVLSTYHDTKRESTVRQGEVRSVGKKNSHREFEPIACEVTTAEVSVVIPLARNTPP